MIGMAYDPGRTSPPPWHDPLRLPVAIGDERGARARRLPGVAHGGRICVTCRQRCPRERNRRAGESDHVASPFAVEAWNLSWTAKRDCSVGPYGGLQRR